jgi:hypothetical protein
MSENGAEVVLAAGWRRGTLVTSPIDSTVCSWHFIELYLSISHQFQVFYGFLRCQV